MTSTKSDAARPAAGGPPRPARLGLAVTMPVELLLISRTRGTSRSTTPTWTASSTTSSTPEALEGASGLYRWGPPPPPSFLAPEDLAALMTAATPRPDLPAAPCRPGPARRAELPDHAVPRPCHRQLASRARSRFMASRLSTGWSSWLSSSPRVRTRPRSGLERDRRASGPWFASAPCRQDAAGRPADLVDTGRGQAGDPGQVVVGVQPHEDPRRVPSAGDQPAERAGGGVLRVDVHGLRIESFGEGDDLIRVHHGVPVLIHRTDRIILEVPVVDGHGEVGLAERARHERRRPVIPVMPRFFRTTSGPPSAGRGAGRTAVSRTPLRRGRYP